MFKGKQVNSADPSPEQQPPDPAAFQTSFWVPTGWEVRNGEIRGSCLAGGCWAGLAAETLSQPACPWRRNLSLKHQSMQPSHQPEPCPKSLETDPKAALAGYPSPAPSPGEIPGQSWCFLRIRVPASPSPPLPLHPFIKHICTNCRQ